MHHSHCSSRGIHRGEYGEESGQRLGTGFTSVTLSSMQSTLRLNLGCGLQAPEGWINIDRSPSITLDRMRPIKRLLHRVGILRDEHMVAWPTNIKQLDLLQPLPYRDGSVQAIYSSHTLEHLYYDDATRLLRECHRVLSEGGMLRLALPDAVQMASRFVEAQPEVAATAALDFTRQLNMGPLSRPSAKQRFMNRFSGSAHRWQPSTALVLDMVRAAGFGNPEAGRFLDGTFPDLATVEHRERSLFVEAIK